MISRDRKVIISINSFFSLIIIRSGLLAEIRWSVSMSKSHRSLCVSFSRTDAELCLYHLFVWSNLNYLHISLWITLPTQSCQVLYSFCANLLHLLIMWLMISFLLPHSLHLVFCCDIIIIIIIPLRVFPISISGWFSTGICLTANRLKSPGLFPVCWPILTML